MTYIGMVIDKESLTEIDLLSYKYPRKMDVLLDKYVEEMINNSIAYKKYYAMKLNDPLICKVCE